MADTNVVSVKLSILEDNANTMVWPLAPVKCNHCQAIILHQATAEMLVIKSLCVPYVCDV